MSLWAVLMPLLVWGYICNNALLIHQSEVKVQRRVVAGDLCDKHLETTILSS